MKAINHQGAFPYITKTLKKAKTESLKGLQAPIKVSYVELDIDLGTHEKSFRNILSIFWISFPIAEIS